MKVVVAVVLVIGTLVPKVSADEQSEASEQFQIRTKIDISGESAFEDTVKQDIEDEIEKLVCEEFGLDFADVKNNCILEDIDEKDWSVDEEEKDNTKTFSGDVKFVVTLKMKEDTKKSDFKQDIQEKVEDIQNDDDSDDGSENGSGEGSGTFFSFSTDENELNNDIFVDFGSILRQESASRADGFKYIDVDSLDTDSFVICVGECKNEGFWMMIAFVSTATLCLIINVVSCLGSRRVRYASSTASTVLLLALMGGMLYVGIVEKVNWKITGGYIGNVKIFLSLIDQSENSDVKDYRTYCGLDEKT